MKFARTITAMAMTALLAACGDGASSSTGRQGENVTSGTAPATETDSDPTPQSGTGGSGQARPNDG